MCRAAVVIMDDHERATPAQRVGIYLAFVEGLLFAFFSAMHFGIQFRLGATTFSAPFLYPAAITEAGLALALLLSVLIPGSGQARAGRVIAAQVMCLLGMIAIQVGMMRGVPLATAATEIFYAVAFVLSIACLILVGSPAYRQRRTAH